MILKQVKIDGKTVYEPIDEQAALEVDRDLLVFTDEDEEEAFDERLEELEHEDDEEDEPAHCDFERDDRFWHTRAGASLVAMLPFMSDEDLSRLTDEIIADPQAYRDKGLPLVALMPFLSDRDCDRLFSESRPSRRERVAMAPFVSDECLDRFISEYVEGLHEDAPIDELYPFLPQKALRKVFDHVLRKRKKGND